MARARKPHWRDRFLDALRVKGNVRESCAVANISRAVAYEARATDEAFAAAWANALDEAADVMEAEAWRRGVEGVDEPVYGRVGKDRDGEIGTVRKYSDSMLALLLKAHKPEKYRERHEHKLDGSITVKGYTTKEVSPDAWPDADSPTE